MAISKLTGKALDLGTDAIEDFTSTGIDDNSTSTVMTIASTGDVTFTNNVAATYFTGDGSALTGIEALPSSIFANGSATANTLHIAANSNIGIGTISPESELEVTGSVLVSDDGVDDFVKLVTNATNTSIEFGNVLSTGGQSKFLYDRSNGSLNGYIGASAVTQFMSVASDGQVTIGALEASAVQPLAPALNLRTSSNVSYLSSGWVTTQNYQPSNSDLIQVKNYETGVDDIFAGIWFETGTPATNTTGERTGRIALVPQNDAAYGANMTFSTRRAATAGLTETMRLSHNGDVLIGTSTETGARLQVESETGTVASFKRTNGDWAYVYIEAGSTTGNSRLYFSDGASAEGGLDYEHSTDQFNLFAGNTFSFSANGNSNAFFLQGNGKAAFQHSGGSGADLSIGSDDNTDSGPEVVVRIGHGPSITARTAEIRKSRNYSGSGNFPKADLIIKSSTGGSDSPIRFYSDNTTERVLFSENGAVSIANSSPSASVKLKVQGTATNTETAVEFFKIGTTANYNASIMKLWANNSYGDSTVTEIKLDAMNGFRQYNADDPGNLIDGSYVCYSNGAFGGDSYIVVQPYGGGEMRGVGGGSANWYVQGTLSKGSGSFRIPHPLIEKRGTHRLVHSFAESPGADLFYSGMVTLVDGTATINIDTEVGMTEGTFVALCREVRRHCTNESGFTAVKSSIVGNILTIEAQDPTCTDEVFWMVVGERQDPTIYESTMTDDDGKVIVEPLIAAEA